MSQSSDQTDSSATSGRLLDLKTGTLLIIANMIGVGVFTQAGFLLANIKSPWAVLAAWVVGGLSALCGAFAYAELGAALPHNGGEFQFLTRIYHPAIGFSAALTSLFIGFSAALAAYGLIFGSYLTRDFLPGVSPQISGLSLLAATSIVHMLRLGFGHRFQNWATLGKLLLIVGLIAAGVTMAIMRLSDGTPLENLGPVTRNDWNAITSMPFAAGLIMVSFAYAGWNAAGYVAGEIQEPHKTLPRILLVGTLVVTVLYCALNWTFLIAVPGRTMLATDDSKQRVAGLAGEFLLGDHGGRIVSFLIIAGLIATAGATTYAGARVTEALGNRYRALRILAIRRVGGGPVFAIGLQFVIAAGLLLSAKVDLLMTYAGFTLILFNMAVVAGVFVLRFREPNLPRPWRMWGYPITPLLFLSLQSWVVWNLIAHGGDHPDESQSISGQSIALFGFGTVLLGIVLYYIVRIGGEAQEAGMNEPTKS